MVVTQKRARRAVKEGETDRGGQRAVGGTEAPRLSFSRRETEAGGSHMRLQRLERQKSGRTRFTSEDVFMPGTAADKLPASIRLLGSR